MNHALELSCDRIGRAPLLLALSLRRAIAWILASRCTDASHIEA